MNFGINATTAREGADEYIRQASRIREEARRTVEELRKVSQAFATGASGGAGVGGGIRVSEDLARRVEQTQRAARAANELSQTDRRMSEGIRSLSAETKKLERDIDGITRARQAATREQNRQIQVAMTALSTLGGEDRAMAQLTQWHIRRAQAMGGEIRSAELLAGLNERLARSTEKASQVFSTQSVNARDLRLNMQNLAAEVTNLAAISGTSLAPLLAIGSAVRRIAVAVGANAPVGGGSTNPSEGGGFGGGFLAGRIGTLARGAAITGGVGAAVGGGIIGAAALREAAQAQVEFAKIEAVIKATGSAAGRTAGQIDELGNSISLATGEANENVNRASAQLLTFASVAGETFDRTLRVSADLAGVFGSLESATMQIGKALEDPVAGFGALRRAGIIFTEAQKEQIKVLVESGRLYEAQEQILAALEGRVGGVAEAVGQTLTGSYRRLIEAGKLWLENAGQQGGVLEWMTRGMNALAAAAGEAAKAQSAVGQLATNDDRLGQARRLADADPGNPDAANAVRRLEEEQQAIRARIHQQNVAETEAAAGQRAAAVEREAERVGAAYEDVRKSLDKAGNAQRAYADQIKTIEAQEKRLGGATNETRKLRELATAALDDATQATGSYTGAVERESVAHVEAADGLRAYTEELGKAIALASLDEKSRVEAASLIEAQERAQRQLTEAEKDAVVEKVRALDAINETRKAEETAARERERASQEATRVQEREQKQREELIRKPFENALTGVQEVFADAFRGIFGGAEENAKGFGQRLLDIMKEVAAQVATLLVFRPIMQGISGASGIGGGGGGFFSQLLSPLLGGGGTTTATGGSAGGGGFFSSILGAGRGLLGGLNTSILGSNTFLGGLLDRLVLRGTISGGLGNSILGATTPLAGLGGLLGGFGGRALGLGSGNGMLDLGLQTGGSLLGGIGGSALGGILGGSLAASAVGAGAGSAGLGLGLSLGAVGGPIGAAIGAMLGLAVGSLMKGLFENVPDHQEFQIYSGGPVSPANMFEDGQFADGPFGRVGILGTKGTQVNQSFSRGLADLFGASDRAIAKSLTADEIESVRIAIENTLGPKVHTRGKDFSESDIATVVQSRLGLQFNALGLSQQLVGIEAQAAAASGNNPNAQYLEALTSGAAKFLEERKTFMDALTEMEAGPLGDAAEALKQLNEQFDALKEGAEAYGVSVDRIEAARQQSVDRLRDDFDKGIQDAYLQLTDPLGALRLAEERAGQKRIDDAIALGADLSAVYQLNALILKTALDEAYKTQANGIREFLRAITATTASPLAPQTVLANAQAEYDKTLAAVRSGDQAAIANLPAVAGSLLDAAQAMFASGPAFFAIFDAIVATAQQLQYLLGNNPTAIVPDLVGQFGRVTQPTGSDLSDVGTLTFSGATGVAGRVSKSVATTSAGRTDSLLTTLVTETAKQTAELAAEQRETRAELAGIRETLAGVAGKLALSAAAPTAA